MISYCWSSEGFCNKGYILRLFVNLFYFELYIRDTIQELQESKIAKSHSLLKSVRYKKRGPSNFH